MSVLIPVKVKPLHPNFQLPVRSTPGAAGVDMRACLEASVTVQPGTTLAIPLGCAVQIQEGYEIQVRPRSGLALKNSIGVLNSPGTIDSDFRGECKVILHNHSLEPFTVDPGDRVCQFILKEVPVAEYILVDELSSTERGSGAFGSTGVK